MMNFKIRRKSEYYRQSTMVQNLIYEKSLLYVNKN